MIGADGYIKIIDYGLAKRLDETEEEAVTYCGTPEYLAPEMVDRQGHDKMVDWWAIGVLIYEMLFGLTPFYNSNQRKLLKKIKASKVLFPDREKFKIAYSENIQNLILSLLEKDRTKRLGCKGGMKEVLSHPLFKDYNIDKFYKGEIDPPFTPDPNNMKFFNAD
jgi:serine/threonine protein kinase